MNHRVLAITMIASLMGLVCAAALFAAAGDRIELPDEVKLQLAQTRVRDTTPNLAPSMSYDRNQYNWLTDRVRTVADYANAQSRNASAPFIMLAGYYDTNVTYAAGGAFKLIAYVMDPDGYSDIANVEIYYNATATGVYLSDDGASGDFGAGDSIFGLSVQIPPNTLPADRYILELVATDLEGNKSDMWPYLTIHP